VLRECERVLRPNGRMSGYVIHVAPGLSTEELALATELGPSEVTAVGTPPSGHAERAGFDVVRQEDVTSDFRETCAAILQARAMHEATLREEEGDEWFDEERSKKSALMEGIDRGFLRRSFIVVRKQAGC